MSFSSVAQLCPTLCDPVNSSRPGLPVHHQLLEFTSIESVMPSSHLILCPQFLSNDCPFSVPRSHAGCVVCCCLLSHVWHFAALCTVGFLCPWDFPGKNTGVGCHFLLQAYFWPRDRTHISYIGRRILYHLAPPWNPPCRIPHYI